MHAVNVGPIQNEMATLYALLFQDSRNVFVLIQTIILMKVSIYFKFSEVIS